MANLQRKKATSEERNFIEKIKASTSLVATSAIETMYEPQLNLEEKDSPS